jgi:hypothetical protein
VDEYLAGSGQRAASGAERHGDAGTR